DESLVAEAAVGLGEQAQVPLEAVIVRARALRARKEYAAARSLLEEVVGRGPQALGPRLRLSHGVVGEGRGLAAAERALVGVLSQFPGHADATHNLKVLRQQRSHVPA